METKHTPGPWVVCVGNAGSIFGDLNNDAHNGDNPYIGEVAGIGVDKNLPECTANAHLIAAAPDMLSALQAALALSDKTLKETGATYRTDECQAVYDQVKAAIEKATGK